MSANGKNGGPSKVLLFRSGGHWFVRARLLWRDCLLMVDTGTARTCVWAEWLGRNKVRLPKTLCVGTVDIAGGQKAPEMELGEVKVTLLPREANRLTLTAIDGGDWSSEFDGLLGMDWFQNYKDYRFQKRGVLTLER